MRGRVVQEHAQVRLVPDLEVAGARMAILPAVPAGHRRYEVGVVAGARRQPTAVLRPRRSGVDAEYRLKSARDDRLNPAVDDLPLVGRVVRVPGVARAASRDCGPGNWEAD